MIEERLITLSRNQGTSVPSKLSLKSWKKMWIKKPVAERVILWIMFAIFAVYGFSLLFPLVWAVINSFKSTRDFDNNSFNLNFKWTLDNYKELITVTMPETGINLFSAIWNSIWMSTLSTFLGIFASCLTSYVCSKYEFKMSGFIYAGAVLLQIIPLVGGITGMYQLIWKTLQIGDEPLFLWPIWFGGFGFSFLMLYGAFKSVPWSYAESAFIDGAGHFRVFLRIMLPQVKPILSSLFVINFISAWNEYMTAHLYMPNHQPLAYAVYLLKDASQRDGGIPAFLAAVTISIIPTLILFIAFQKLIMENTTTGGLKG